MSSHAALILAILTAYLLGSSLMLGLIWRADRAKARERERARLEAAETAADEMRLAA